MQRSLWEKILIFGMDFNPAPCFSALRIAGPPHFECLQLAIEAVSRRHEALRTRIANEGDKMIQRIAADPAVDFEVLNIEGATRDDREIEAQRVAGEIANAPFDFLKEPLFHVKMLRLDARNHVLLVLMDHMISDGRSVEIVAHDFLHLYLLAITGQQLWLPPVGAQFADYAVWQQKGAAEWNRRHAEYWKQRLSGAAPTRIAPAKLIPGQQPATVQIRFGCDLTDRLRRLGRQSLASFPITVLAVYIALVYRWTLEQDITVSFMMMGREYPQLRNTVGFFAYPLFLRVIVHPDERFSSLLRQTMEQYLSAIEHRDGGRANLRWPESFTNTTCFNWLPATRNRDPSREIEAAGERPGADPSDHVRMFEVSQARGKVEWNARMIEHIDALGSEPAVSISEVSGELLGNIHYVEDVRSQADMEHFSSMFLTISAAVCECPKMRVCDFLNL